MREKWDVRPSPIHGNGIFATQIILEHERIGMSHTGYPLDIRMLPLGNYNHSLTPSAYSRLDVSARARFIYAARDLMPGDEITLNFYEAPELEQPQEGRTWNKVPRFRKDLPMIYSMLDTLFPK